MLEVGSKVESFVPAFLVKSIRKWPNDYRKRLSELKEKKLVKRIGTEGQFAKWAITKLGRKSIK
jgi:hypothetical protein